MSFLININVNIENVTEMRIALFEKNPNKNKKAFTENR